MSAQSLVVRFGNETIINVSAASTTVRQKQIPDAEVHLPRSSLYGRTIEYLTDVTVADISSPQEERLFTGVVDAVRVDGNDVEIKLVMARELEEKKLKGLAIANVDPREMVWAICRMSGMRNEQIRIQGYVTGPV